MTRSGKARHGNVHDAVRSGAPPVWPRFPRTPRGCRVRRISDGARDGARDYIADALIAVRPKLTSPALDRAVTTCRRSLQSRFPTCVYGTAFNAAGEQFGEERLRACLDANRQCSPAELLECLLSAVRSFAVGAPQYDDVTALVLRYTVAEQISALDGNSRLATS